MRETGTLLEVQFTFLNVTRSVLLRTTKMF